MSASTLVLLDAGQRHHWEGFHRDRPHLKGYIPYSCSDLEHLGAGLEVVAAETKTVILTCLTSYLVQHLRREYLADSARTISSEFMTAILKKALVVPQCHFFVMPPFKVTIPRWYSGSFAIIFRAFEAAVKSLPANVHITPYHDVRLITNY